MMSFWKTSKWMAVLALGTALLFAGCMGPSSSDDSAIPAKAAGAKYVYKFDMDPQSGTLDIEPVVMGNAISTTHFGGTIDVTTVGACSAIDAVPSTCTVKITNLTPGMYAANLRTWEYNTSSGSATLSTADFGGPLLDNSGMCILDDAAYCFTCSGPLAGSNPGCQTYQYSAANKTQVKNILHPDCGSISDSWTFGTDTTRYQFYTALVDSAAGATTDLFDFYPEDPTGDSRMNHTNFSTFVAVPYQVDMACPDSTCKIDGSSELWGCIGDAAATFGYRIGSPKCSTALDTSAKVASGSYFAVNLGIEYADRVESQNHASLNGTGAPNGCFDWMQTAYIGFSWDPAVLQAFTTDDSAVFSNVLAPGSSGLPTILHVSPNRTQYTRVGDGADSTLGTGGYINEWDGLDVAPQAMEVASNYMSIKRGTTSNFTFRTVTVNPLTCIGDIYNSTLNRYGTAAGYPLTPLGWHGLASYSANCGTYTDDPVDAAVDEWLGLEYFKVIGASGSGSIIKIEPTTDATYLSWYNSNCSRAGGYATDIYTWCQPCTGAPCDATGAGAFTCTGDMNTPTNYVFNSVELTNMNLVGGPNSARGAGYQTWNAHICVQ